MDRGSQVELQQIRNVWVVAGFEPETSIELFVTVLSDPMLGAVVIDAAGNIVLASDNAAGMLLGPGSLGKSLVGGAWKQNLPPRVVDDRLDAVEHVRATGSTMIDRTVWFGRQLVTRCTPMASGDRTSPVLAIFRWHRGELDLRAEVVRYTDFTHLGFLSALSRSELRVLAMLGQGYEAAEIATIQSRSKKTINRHLDALRRKLGTHRSTKLALIAQDAGLRPEDADLPRLYGESTPDEDDE